MKSNNAGSTSNIRLWSIGQLGGAALAIALLWSVGLIMAMFAMVQLLVIKNAAESGAILLTAAAMLLIGILCVPSVYYPLCRILNWQSFDILGVLHRIRPSLLIILFPVVLLLGYGAAKLPGLQLVLLPILNILAVGLPVLWILYITIRRLPSGSSQRIWGVFNSGLVLGPALILFFELIALLTFIVVIAVEISNQPMLVEQFFSFSEQFSRNPPTPEEMIKILAPVLGRPEVIIIILIFAAIVVPVIEEMIKPVGVWLLGGRRLTPAAGFAAGALSGAGYALMESLLLSTGGDTWIIAMVGRAGTAVLHVATSSLMGWALVRSWKESSYFQLGLAFLGAVLVHGVWNGLAVVTAFASFSSQIQIFFIAPEILPWLEVILPSCLVGFVALIFCSLLWANQQLASQISPVPSQVAGAKSNEIPIVDESIQDSHSSEDAMSV